MLYFPNRLIEMCFLLRSNSIWHCSINTERLLYDRICIIIGQVSFARYNNIWDSMDD